MQTLFLCPSGPEVELGERDEAIDNILAVEGEGGENIDGVNGEAGEQGTKHHKISKNLKMNSEMKTS